MRVSILWQVIRLVVRQMVVRGWEIIWFVLESKKREWLSYPLKYGKTVRNYASNKIVVAISILCKTNKRTATLNKTNKWTIKQGIWHKTQINILCLTTICIIWIFLKNCILYFLIERDLHFLFLYHKQKEAYK